MIYKTIWADPPWDQKAGRPINGYKIENGKQLWVPESNISKNLPYNTMTVQEICDLPFKHLVEGNAHLYLWVTNKYLRQAFTVIDAWGFKYSTCITWKKAVMGGGLGGAFGISHEHLLFCRRGTLPAKTRIKGTVFEVKRPYVNGYPCHSKKPDFFYELTEQVSPGPYLELFARHNRPGWDAYGNEVENSIELITNNLNYYEANRY